MKFDTEALKCHEHVQIWLNCTKRMKYLWGNVYGLICSFRAYFIEYTGCRLFTEDCAGNETFMPNIFCKPYDFL